MIQLTNGGYYTSWAEGEEPASGSRYTYLDSPATIRSSHINVNCGASTTDFVTNFGANNTINGTGGACIYSLADSAFLTVDAGTLPNTIKSFSEHATIKCGGSYSSNAIVAYGGHNFIDIYSNNNTIKSYGEHDTIKCTAANNNLILSRAESISIGSWIGRRWAGNHYETVTVGCGNTTLCGSFATANMAHDKNTVILHDAQDNSKMVRGFSETSTLLIANSTFSTYQDADDVWVLVGDNTITLEGAASLSPLNIEETDVNPSLLFRETLPCDVERIIYPPSFVCDIERNIAPLLDFNEVINSVSDSSTSGSSISGGSENTSGIQSIKIRIAEQQITDQVTFTSVVPFEILQCIEGKYFDYEYAMRIESITKSGILYTYTCCSDLDKLLYELLNMDAGETVTNWYDSTGATVSADNEEAEYITSAEHIETIAEKLGLEFSYQAIDFTSTVDPKVPGITFLDLIRSIFGWTARIPTLLINVFIRGKKLYAIQRGQEENVVDISNANISQPIFLQEVVRTKWGETPYNKTEIKSVPLSSTRYIYEGADKARIKPLESDTREDVDGTTTIHYSYDSDGLLIKTEERSPKTVTITEHKYITGTTGNKVLSEERTTVYDLSGNQIDYRSVKHSHTNYGQAAVTAGNANSENIVSMAKNVPFDERPSPYALGQHLKAIITEKTGSKQLHRILSGVLPFDSSFPVLGGTLEVIMDEIENLNRSYKETVTLSLFNYPHIIDFNDRIVLFGEEYFLSSNEISTTPHIRQQQNLTLVRFF